MVRRAIVVSIDLDSRGPARPSPSTAPGVVRPAIVARSISSPAARVTLPFALVEKLVRR